MPPAKKTATALTEPRRGRGRPALDAEQKTVPVNIRMTLPQREKLARLGGAPWVRAKIDKAPEPKD